MWIYIDDPGVDDEPEGNPDGIPDHEPFNGYMSKYETTNGQYCQFLNAALASGDIVVDGNDVKGASGPYSGQNYYNLAGAGFTYDGATNGGAARINWTGSSFTVDSGFDNHPVTYVSWYGSTAFASYYGWRLPTEWEWQAVADHTIADPFIYSCGASINNNIANYYGSTHPDGTTVVGSFGTYGYGMCDMAGNVWEWTDSCFYIGCNPDYRILRGGSWNLNDYICTVSYRRHDRLPHESVSSIGFRVCR
ncbi:MAG: SUMF1/EgtB/PvdO family nonheme iron enzyme [Planctomycetes bacterium]|nr:SUMF1/EgtB/PvdO family nonheme iron enzyme [Planctomycetota bacterium]